MSDPPVDMGNCHVKSMLVLPVGVAVRKRAVLGAVTLLVRVLRGMDAEPRPTVLWARMRIA